MLHSLLPAKEKKKKITIVLEVETKTSGKAFDNSKAMNTVSFKKILRKIHTLWKLCPDYGRY